MSRIKYSNINGRNGSAGLLAVKKSYNANKVNGIIDTRRIFLTILFLMYR